MPAASRRFLVRSFSHYDDKNSIQTDGDGTCHVAMDSPALRVAVVAGDYVPARLDIIRGLTFDVVLTPIAPLIVRVTNEMGQPITGYGVSASTHMPSREDASHGFGESDPSMHVFAGDALLACATTDDEGVARLRVPSGTYHLAWNTTSLPVFSLDMKDLVALAAPGEYRVTVQEPIACVVSLQGDDVLACRIAPRGARFVGDHDNARIRQLALTDLAKRFPGCHHCCEMPPRKGKAAVAAIYSLGRYSGLRRHEVPMQPLSRIGSPSVLDLPTSAEPQVGSVVLHVANPDGTKLELSTGELMFRARCGDDMVAFDLPAGRVFELPVGDIEIVQGPSGMPLGAFADSAFRVTPGGPNTLSVAMSIGIYRGRLSFRTQSGDQPFRGSVSYGLGESMRTRLMTTGTTIEGWFADGTRYTASFRGKHYEGTINIDTTASPNQVRDWQITID